MAYAIDPDGTGAVGSTLFSSDVALRDSARGVAHAGGLTLHALADDQPLLNETSGVSSAHISP